MRQVCIGNINDGTLRAEFFTSLWSARAGSPAVAQHHLLHTWGPYLDDSRNTVVDAFLTQTEDDILLFADSDICFLPEHVSELADLIGVQPVVGGLYYSGFNRDGVGTAPVAYRWGTHPETTQPFLRQIDPVEDKLDEAIAGDIIKVDAIGTGFLAIHRDVLTQMGADYGWPSPWFCEPIIENVHHGEDFGFCLRLAEMGIPLYLAPHVRVKHLKVCAI